MRIISGLLKGKSLNFIKNLNTRPLKDIVKESIFNVLKHSNHINIDIENSNVIDLYSGVGSFGIECISRGANKVIFIEQDIGATNILNKNLKKLNILHKATVKNDKIENVFKKENFKQFDILFLDPPFKDKKFTEILKVIKEKHICNKKHVVIIHREKKVEDYLKDSIDIVLAKNYGRSKIIFGTFN